MKTKNIIIGVAAFLVSMGIVIAVGLIFFGRNNIDKQIQEQLRLGQRYLSEMKYEEAIVAFRKVIELDPKNTEAYVSLADAYAENGQLEEALEVLENAPEDVDDPDEIEEKLEEIQQLAKEQKRENAENETTAAGIETDSEENIITEEETTTAAAETTATENEASITPDEATAIWENFFISGDYLTFMAGDEFVFIENGELQFPLEYAIMDINEDTIPELFVRESPDYTDVPEVWLLALYHRDIQLILATVGETYWWYSPDKNAIGIAWSFVDNGDFGDAEFYQLDAESMDIELIFGVDHMGDQCYYFDYEGERNSISDDEFSAYFDDMVEFPWKSVQSLTGETVETTAAAAETTRPVFVPWAEAGLEDHVMDWKDEVLEARMREITGIYDRDIWLSDVWGMTRLDLNSNSNERTDKIESIDALTELTNLTELNLDACGISDLTPLSNLMSLTRLSLNDNQIRDIAPLANMTSLTDLELGHNQISDITPLSNVASLTWLFLESNQISDITPLSNLTELEVLWLMNNQIIDVTSLSHLTSLASLHLEQNRINDVTPLSNLTSLTALGLSGNQISDVTPLANLTALTSLQLTDNPITDYSPVEFVEGIRY